MSQNILPVKPGKIINFTENVVMLMLMLMPVSAGPAESQTCSRAIVVMASDSHTPNTRPKTMPVFQLRHAFG